MKDKKLMSIVLEDGSIDEVEVLVSFKFTDTNKEYVVYTKNELDDMGNVTIYVASLKQQEGKDPILGGVESEEEWDRIKDLLRDLSKPQEKN